MDTMLAVSKKLARQCIDRADYNRIMTPDYMYISTRNQPPGAWRPWSPYYLSESSEQGSPELWYFDWQSPTKAYIETAYRSQVLDCTNCAGVHMCCVSVYLSYKELFEMVKLEDGSEAIRQVSTGRYICGPTTVEPTISACSERVEFKQQKFWLMPQGNMTQYVTV